MTAAPLRPISSAATFPVKFFSPPMFVASIAYNALTSSPVIMELSWGVVPILLVTLYYLWLVWPIKRVLVDDANKLLYVSNFRREIAIPLSEVAAINEFLFAEPPIITIHLRHSTEFGEKISFLAKYRLFNWSSHPVVEELRRLSANSQK